MLPVRRYLPVETALLPRRPRLRRMTDESVEGSFEDMPPSAKLVAKVIEHEGAMDAGEISDAARLPQSTTRNALNRLVDEGVVDVSVGSGDGRRLVYSMKDDFSEA